MWYASYMFNRANRSFCYLIKGRDVTKDEAVEIRDNWKITSACGKEGDRRFLYWKYEAGTTIQYYRSRIIWAAENGPVPPFHVIHHRDFDTTNDDIENLECLHSRTHLQLHYISKTNENILEGQPYKNVAGTFNFYEFLCEHGLDFVGVGPLPPLTLTTAQNKSEPYTMWIE